MKKILLQLVKIIAAVLHWKWLYFIAGIGLISSIHSCKPAIKHCYKPSVPENDTIIQPSCYDMPSPPDTVMDTHDNNEEMR